MSNITNPPQDRKLDRDELSLAFLRRVLPPEGSGPYCLWTKSRAGAVANAFANSIEDLWQMIRERDRRGQGNVYFAIATFEDNSSRKADNAVALQTFVADIDVNPEKAKQGTGYASLIAAREALKRFRHETGLPSPMVVESGHGLHVYWPLTKPVPAAEWKRLAEKLKQLFATHGLHADPAVTADAAGVLRAPGTMNRKKGMADAEVKLHQEFLNVGPYELETFTNIFDRSNVLPFGRRELGPVPAFLKAVAGRILIATALAPEPFPISDAEPIAEACAQIRHMRDTGGLISEPEWHSCIGVVARCEDGDKFCHEWSRGDERYNSAETQAKIDRALKETTGPTKCETFEGLGNGRCEGCPHRGKITSPIALGRRPSDPAVVPMRAAVERDIAEVNKDYFLVPIGSKVVVGSFKTDSLGREELQLWLPESFKLWFKNRYVQVIDGADSARMRPLGEYWLGHRDRRQYKGVDLVPGEPPELPNGKLNLWRGYGVEPRPGNWPRMRHHVDNVLAGGDPKAAEYILRWAAYCLQNPGRQAEVALVLMGERGSGKGIFLRALARCFGSHALHLSNQDHLLGKFNSHMRNALYLFADEAFWAGDKRGEGVLKALITEPSIMVEQKGIDAVNWPNRLSIAMATNLDWAVPAGAGERRFAVFQCTDRYVRGRCDDAERTAYFSAIYHELDNGGAEAMLCDLLHMDLGDWHPRQVYETAALQQQKAESLGHLESWWVELLQDGKAPGAEFNRERKDCATTVALMEDAAQKSPRLRNHIGGKGIATFLRKHDCTPWRDMSLGGRPRGWRLPPLAEARKTWERRYGSWVWRWLGEDWS